MKNVRRILVLLCWLALFRQGRATPHVVIISVDGLRPDSITTVAPPLLARMIQEGAYTARAQTVVPANTLPSHASMLTGVLPKRHRMFHDDLDLKKGLVKAPTIFELATAAGMKSAMFFAKNKFLHLVKKGSPTVYRLGKDASSNVMKLACEEIERNQPELVFIGLPDPDSEGHIHGWMSPQYLGSVRQNDKCLQSLMKSLDQAGILKDTTIILSADHGGHKHVHGTKDPLDMTIPWLAWGRGIAPGVSITEPVSTCDTAATALQLLGIPLPEGLDGKPVAAALRTSTSGVKAR